MKQNCSESPAQSPAQPLISLRHVEMIMPQRRVLSGVDLDVNAGDFMLITGPNGGGKTTLLRIMLRLLKPSRGEVVYSPGLNNIGYLPQKNRVDSMFPITVTDVIASGLLTVGDITKSEKESRIESTISILGLESHATNPIGAVSGGQLQRALLGRAIISRPQLLVMDEPLSFIDHDFESRFYEILRGLSTHTTVVVVSHDVNELLPMANRHIVVNETIE